MQIVCCFVFLVTLISMAAGNSVTSKYWIKLYVEILQDYKMGELNDHLWRRAIEAFLLAGDINENGSLPDIKTSAWLLRVEPDELKSDWDMLAKSKILTCTGADQYTVTNYAKRQSALSSTERWREWQKRQHKETYYQPPSNSNETPNKRISNESLVESESDKIRKETESEEHIASAFFNPVKILADSSGLSDFPADQREWIEVIHSLVDDHGIEETTKAMKQACQAWSKTKSKNGHTYRVTNLSWINWAQNLLLGGDLPSQGKKKLTAAEKRDLERRAHLEKTQDA